MKPFPKLSALTALLVLVLTTCTTPTPPPTFEPVTITFACKDYQHDWYHDLAEEFHRLHPEIAVKFVSAEEVTGHGPEVSSTDDVQKVSAAADTFVDSSYILGRDTPQDIVLDLTDLADQDEKFTLDDFYSGPLAPFQRNGRLWGLPFEANMFLIFYNPKLFDTAGVPHPQIGWSWDDFLMAASRLTIREGETVKQYGYMDPWPYYSLPSLAHQKAGRLVDLDRDPPLARLDAASVAEAVQWYADLILVHSVMPNPATMDSISRQRFPYEQSPAMWVGLAHERDNFEHLYSAGVVPFPEVGEAATAVSAWGYFASAGTLHPEAAWRWIEFLSRQPLSPYTINIPARKSVAEKDRYWKKLDKETATVYQYILDHTVSYPREIYLELNNAFEAVLQGETAEAALTTAQARASAGLAEAAAEAQRSPKALTVATPAPTPTPGGIQIRFLAPPNADLAAYRNLVKRFHQTHPEIAVEISPSQGRDLAEQAAAADCFAWYAHGLGLKDPDALLALDPFITDDKAFSPDVFSPVFLEPLQVDGTLWALPLETDAWLLYYNRDLFDATRTPYPAADWTPQQLIKEAVTLTDSKSPEPVYGFYPRNGVYADAPDYVTWLGGQLFDTDGQPAFDNPTVTEALTRYAGLIAQATPPSARERGESRWPYPVWIGGHPGPAGQGSIAMWVDLYSNHRHAPPLDFKVGVAPPPAGAVPLAAFSPRALFISAQAPYPTACWTWIAFLSAQPEAVSLLPARRDIAASDGWRNQVGPDTAGVWQTILVRGQAIQRPWPSSMAYYALYWFDEALADVLAGARPSAALAKAQVKAAAFAECIAGRPHSQEIFQTCARQIDPTTALPGD